MHNTLYNPGGRIRAADYRFPYPDASFDLVFAISLFTHLVPENAEHYLKEAARVIAPGGRMFLTWFVLTDAPAPSPSLDFHASLGEAKVINPQNLEAAIAFPESWVRDRLATNGLVLWEPIQLGYWRGSRSICYQDIVVAQRT